MIKVYTASKLHHGAMWRALCQTTPHVFFHARWLKHTLIGTPDTQEYAAQFWIEDEQDIKSADAMFVYAEDGEHLRGALVEAGMAIAYGIPVFVIGTHQDFGTWQHHPGVTQAPDLKTLLQTLEWSSPACIAKKVTST